MSKSLLASSFCCVALWASTCYADVGELRAFLESTLAEKDGSLPPSSEEITKQLSVVPTLAPDEVRDVLTLGQRCIRAPGRAARAYGLNLILVVSFRPDGSQLLERYLDDVASFLSDPDLGFRREAILILGSNNPRPSSKGLGYLAAHLKDKDNTFWEAGMIAASLLDSFPSDSGTVRSVLSVVQERADPRFTTTIIRDLGLSHVTTEDALKFIRNGLADTNPIIRRACVDSLRQMPKEVRSGFAAELQSIVGNPNEAPETRSLAGAVFIQ